MRLFAITLANVIGVVVIISILEPYFPFYRESARELKRLHAMLRSVLYAHFSESLTGLSTIRSYGELPRFVKGNTYYIDLENRALFLTVAMLAVAGASALNTAQIGLVLTYTTTLTQLCGLLTRQSAEVENYMSSVERIVHYSEGDAVAREAPYEKEDVKPPPEWLSNGAIEFTDVSMNYRQGLPNILRSVSLSIKAREKIRVVGRTGAGKSSLMMVLYLIVELNSGSISVDGIDISTLGLRDLRSKIAIIPQDVSGSNSLKLSCAYSTFLGLIEPLLFSGKMVNDVFRAIYSASHASGTVRSNLDPPSLYDDAHLWDALRRSYLVSSSNNSSLDNVSTGETTLACVSRFDLDTVIESEGANLSVGERSLLSLARALVKNSQVVVLDEATSILRNLNKMKAFDRT
ncbi:hypothetical protein EW146_g4487 [Bondarzewia mesenterica]|uniref:ABC transporter domain-containing protein n=1 Tax=Bondarzewia mesenterica TaxID=1095465 RepID=A0A4S4LUG4_9AGAM|nr:hypothetical protein EW146_g4487 [Bondarzewia mesenterica]